MTDSEKPWGLADTIKSIIESKYERYTRTITKELGRKYSSSSWSREAHVTTPWDEFKIQVCNEPTYGHRMTNQLVRSCCSALLRGLPNDEISVLALADTQNKDDPNRFLRELYDRVRDLALDEAEIEAFLEGTPDDLKLPVSSTSEEIVTPLALFIATTIGASGVLAGKLSDANLSSFYHAACAEDPLEVEKALQVVFSENADFFEANIDMIELLGGEDINQAMRLQRRERGKFLYERIMRNLESSDDIDDEEPPTHEGGPVEEIPF